jgi:uncharacterized membrane protein YfcA
MHWTFLAFALICSGFVQGLCGFGFGLVSMSLMPLVIPIKQAAAISTIFSLLATVATFVRHFREYNWRLGLTFLICVCAGVPAGVYFLDRASETVLLRILGVMMLVFAGREFLLSKQPKAIPGFLTIPMGLFSGGLSGAFNLGGIPTAAYAYSHPWTRGQIMAFLQVMITSSSLLRIFCYKKFGMLSQFSLLNGLLLLVPLYLAIWLGHFVMTKVPQKQMRRSVFGFIGATGVYYLVR